MTTSTTSSSSAGDGKIPASSAPQLQAPLDTAALAQLASSIFRALPGQAPVASAPQLPMGAQAPANIAPAASPLSSPAGLAPNLPGTPIAQGQIPGSNLLPASPAQVLNLSNRAPALLPHAPAGNGVSDKAFMALPGYEPRLASITQNVPAVTAPALPSAVPNPSIDNAASPFYFVSNAALRPSSEKSSIATPQPANTASALGESVDSIYASKQQLQRPNENVELLAQQAIEALKASTVPSSHLPDPRLSHTDASPIAQQVSTQQATAQNTSYYFLAAPASSAPKNEHPPFDVHAIRADFPILAERVHGKPLVWLDNAATTQKPKQVIERIAHFYQHENSNIHRAAHDLAARATDAYEHAREVCRRFINAPEVEEIIFVRGTTEAINLIAKSWGGQNIGQGDEIIISHLEHHANIVPWQQLAQEKGATLRVIPVDEQGQVRLDEYQKLINDRTKIVSVAHVSNTLGTVVPIKEIVEIAKRRNIVTVIDGAQSIAHTPVDVQAIGADFFVFSGHKIFGPTGIGVLWGKRSVLEDMPPWQGGGNMIADVTFEKTVFQPLPNTFEAGTGNIADAVGLGAALEYVERIGIENISQYEHALVDYGMQALGRIDGVRLIGTVPGKASVLSFVLQGYSTDDVGKILNAQGIAVRTGHHCAQPILRRFGVETAIRPSLAFYNTYDEIDQLVGIIAHLASQKRGH